MARVDFFAARRAMLAAKNIDRSRAIAGFVADCGFDECERASVPDVARQVAKIKAFAGDDLHGVVLEIIEKFGENR